MTRKPAIVVTGCSSGIGAHCAGRLRADGWHVVVTARKETDLERLRGEGFDAVYLDYCEPSSIEACFALSLEATGGRLDALFNNGAYAQPGAVEDVPVEALRAQFEANLFGWHHLTRLAVPAMRQQGAGRIVHNSSVLGFVPVPLRGAYTASKYALEGLMLTLRQELAGSGIHVSLIEPGPVPSRFAMNTLPWIERFIDVKGSVHAEAYRARLEQLRAGGTGDDGGKALDWCYRALSAALTDARPRPHYHVTPQTRLAALGKRVAPSDLLYRLWRAAPRFRPSLSNREQSMSGPLFYLAILAMLAVFAVLLAGLRNMMKQGDANVSNKLMQLRVFLQFVAVVIIVLVVYLARQGSSGAG